MRILVAERGGEGQALHMQKPSYALGPPNREGPSIYTHWHKALQTEKGPPYRDREVLYAPRREKDRLRQSMRAKRMSQVRLSVDCEAQCAHAGPRARDIAGRSGGNPSKGRRRKPEARWGQPKGSRRWRPGRQLIRRRGKQPRWVLRGRRH